MMARHGDRSLNVELPKPEPWERQQGESDPAWEAFLMYREMGADRTIFKVAGKLGKARSLIERWSAENRWGARIASYDIELDRERMKTAKDAVREMSEKHIQIALLMEQKGLMKLQAMSEEEVTDLPRWMQTAVSMERLARGEATARMDLRQIPKLDLTRLTDEELAELDRLVGKAHVEGADSG